MRSRPACSGDTGSTARRSGSSSRVRIPDLASISFSATATASPILSTCSIHPCTDRRTSMPMPASICRIAIHRLTITPGIRFEHFNTSIALETVGEGRFVAARTFPEVPNLPNWNDIAPRFGIVYDLFGNAKTAIRASVGKYMVAYSTVGFAQVYNPMFEQTDVRTWRDLNGDDIAQDTEIGPSQNSQFGIAPVRKPDPNIKRPYNMEYSASIQREMARGVSVSFGYFRRGYHRLIWSENVAAGPQDYTPIVITNPIDGTPLTVYNLNPAKLGAINIVDKNSSTNSRVYNGIEVTYNARLRRATLFGGINSGRQISNNCQVYVGQILNSITQPITAASNPNLLAVLRSASVPHSVPHAVQTCR